MELDIDMDGWPEGLDCEGLAQAACEATRAVEPALSNARLTASILFTSDEEVRILNRDWREKDEPTNVLSFPMMQRAQLLNLAKDGAPEMLGDIALAHGICLREAQEKGIALQIHVTHLLVHGFLHLAGHDHVDSEEQAAAMEGLEIAALAKLGIADPYGDRDR